MEHIITLHMTTTCVYSIQPSANRVKHVCTICGTSDMKTTKRLLCTGLSHHISLLYLGLDDPELRKLIMHSWLHLDQAIAPQYSRGGWLHACC